jgi:hypothetical protein
MAPCAGRVTVRVWPVLQPPPPHQERDFQVIEVWQAAGANFTAVRHTRLFWVEGETSAVVAFPITAADELTHVMVSEVYVQPVINTATTTTATNCPAATPLPLPVVCPVLPAYPCQYTDAGWVCGGDSVPACSYTGEGRFVCPVAK